MDSDVMLTLVRNGKEQDQGTMERQEHRNSKEHVVR